MKMDENYSPLHWGFGLVSGDSEELDLRMQSSVMKDRYDRGTRVWNLLLETRWWQFGLRHRLKANLERLRGEYRDLLDTLVQAELRRRVHVIEVIHPAKAKFTKTTPKGKTELWDPIAEDLSGETVYVRAPELKVAGTFEPSPIGGDISDWFPGQGTSFEPPAPPSFEGHGGSFGGAGATVDWSPEPVSAAPDNIIDTPSVEVPSVDIPSSD